MACWALALGLGCVAQNYRAEPYAPGFGPPTDLEIRRDLRDLRGVASYRGPQKRSEFHLSELTTAPIELEPVRNVRLASFSSSLHPSRTTARHYFDHSIGIVQHGAGMACP